MGRGRAKAKQTKVARQLKYSTGDLDVSKLSAELGATPEPGSADSDDPYAEAVEAPTDEDDRRQA